MRFGQTAPVANPALPPNHPVNLAAAHAATLAANAPPPQPGTYGSGIQVGSSEKNRFWFTYQTANIATLAPGSTTTNTILFDNDSVFQWTKLTATADISNAAQESSTIVVPLVTVQILDTGTGAYYSNAQIPLAAYAGAWGLPYVLPAPQFIAPNASLQFNYTNFTTAGGGNITYDNLRLQLHGFKIKLR